MNDQRTPLEKLMWDNVGPPLYYCSECLRGMKVKAVSPGVEPVITRPCKKECGHQIIAPRQVICVGRGGASIRTKFQIAWMRLKASLTGRSA